jgi:hypothetical protein
LSNGGDNMNFFKRSSKICFNTNWYTLIILKKLYLYL